MLFVLSLLFVLPLFKFTIQALVVLLDWVDEDAHSLRSAGPGVDPGIPGYDWARNKSTNTALPLQSGLRGRAAVRIHARAFRKMSGSG